MPTPSATELGRAQREVWDDCLGAIGSGGAELAAAIEKAFAAGCAPGERRGFVSLPLDAIAPPRRLSWSGGYGRVASLSLLDLASGVDEPEAIEACFKRASAVEWGAISLSTAAALCAQRGAFRSLAALWSQPRAVEIAALPSGSINMDLSAALLSMGALGDPEGLACAKAMRDALGAQAFGAWAKRHSDKNWRAVAALRAWGPESSDPLLSVWARQAKTIGDDHGELSRFAQASLGIITSLGLLPSFEREIAHAGGRLAPWAGLMQAEGWSLSGMPPPAPELAEAAMAKLSKATGSDANWAEDAKTKLRASIERWEIGAVLAASGPSEPARTAPRL